MAERFISERNLRFCLYEVFDVLSLTRYPYFEEHTREGFELVLDTALKIAKEMLLPILAEMDKNPPVLVDQKVKVHPMVAPFMKLCGEGGWIAATAPFELGGQQLPIMVSSACRFIFSAANYSASIYPLLTSGAAHLIESFASKEMIDTYIPAMFSGDWQGTMALTEPQAGSSLADITMEAEPTHEGHYLLRGQKIFISAGDHDGVERVIHLMLATIKGAPAGVKGISLFVVPNKRPDEAGILVPNDLTVSAIYHKLGYRGAPITQLSLGENGDCRGYLVGEPHRGLYYMFQMMNEARIDVGIGAAAIASAAYHAAVEYARERPQGRRLTDKDPTLPPVVIVEHPDVKRMLLFQKAVVEGSLCLILQCCQYADKARVLENEDKERAELLLDLLTPVAKTYPSEMGVLSVSQGLQCLGGYGYCDEFPLEQLYRDARIHPIHEGTTGIQGLDLLGRKVPMKNGKAFSFFTEEVMKAISACRGDPALSTHAASLGDALALLRRVTDHLLQFARSGETERFLADATLYLELFGLVSVGWQWLLQGLVVQRALGKGPSESDARFYKGKRYALRYFFYYELPKIQGLATRLMDSDPVTVEMSPAFFTD
jgi:alkylation response protein AidB-like acyl-CoA dehydrogenase